MRPALIQTALLFAVISLSLQSHAQSRSEPQADLTDSEYQVLSAYLGDTYIGKKGEDRVGAHIAKIVIANKTQSDQEDPGMEGENGRPIPWSETSRFLRKQSPMLQASTLNSFRVANTHPLLLRPRLQLSLPYEVVDKSEIDAILRNDGWWTDYYKKYPGSQGFLTVSRVGFSADGKEAMFYSTNFCGGLCGEGTYVVMEKVGATWRIAKEIMMWVS